MAKTRPGIPTKTKTGKRDLESYTIRGTNKIVRGTYSSICLLTYLSICTMSSYFYDYGV